jgi:hypothetical protein
MKTLGKRIRLMLQRPATAKHNHPIQLLPTTGTIAGIVGIIAIIVQARPSNSSIADKLKKGEPGGSPFLVLTVSTPKHANCKCVS